MNKDDINKLFDKLSSSDDKKEEIYKNIISNQKLYEEGREVISNKKVRKRYFRPAILCMFALLFSITVFAVGTRDSNFSSNIIDWSLSEGATILNISDVDKGYRITAESVYGDKKVAYVVLSLEREDGKKIKTSEKDSRSNFWINANNESLSKDGNDDIADSLSNYALNKVDGESNKLYFLKRYTVDTDDYEGISAIGSNLHLEIDRINVGKLGIPRKGNWVLDIPLDYKDLSKTYELNYEFEYDGKKAMFEKINISPLNISIYLKSDENALKDISLSSFEEHNFIYIKLKEGTDQKLFNDSASGTNIGSEFYAGFSLVETGAIDAGNIESIIIGDVEILINLE